MRWGRGGGGGGELKGAGGRGLIPWENFDEKKKRY